MGRLWDGVRDAGLQMLPDGRVPIDAGLIRALELATGVERKEWAARGKKELLRDEH